MERFIEETDRETLKKQLLDNPPAIVNQLDSDSDDTLVVKLEGEGAAAPLKPLPAYGIMDTSMKSL